jgi:hypothetical protein
MNNIKSKIGLNLTNIRGWKTNRKIIVFESDDWGSIRMPSSNILKIFKELGYDLSKDPYCSNDTLANAEDLNLLFEVLRTFVSSEGVHPKFTFNTVMANPEFDKIKETGFNEYFYEPFTKTIEDYYPNENVFNLWRQGTNEKLIQPQFHGREHVNVNAWMSILKEGNKPLLKAFELGFWGIPKKFYGMNNISIQASFASGDRQSIEFYEDNIREGLQLFENIFGFGAKTFIPNNYTYPESLNYTLYDEGILGIQGMRKQKIPQENGSVAFKEIYTGKRNQWQQIYMVRNAMFEPSQMPTNFDNIGNCLKQISNAYFWKKPAIINSHRLNYVGSINKENRTRNLDMLKTLLGQILKTWPEVEFLSSDELVNIIN